MAASAVSTAASSSAAYASGWRTSLDTSANADGDAAVEAELVALARSQGPLRAALAELCARFVECSGFERLGFASLADWAAERVGRSGRTVYDHAHVGKALRGLPELRAALRSGALGFAKLRLVARVASAESERRWIGFARALGAEALAREVRKIDAGSLEYGGLARDERRARRLEFACSPEVVALWGAASTAAQRVAGRMLRTSERAELIAAEVASALPIDADSESSRESAPGECEARPVPGSGDSRAALAASALAPDPTSLGLSPPPLASPWLAEGVAACGAASLQSGASQRDGPGDPFDSTGHAIPLWSAVDAWLAGIEQADPFELERRLIEAFSFDQRWASELGPRLEFALRRGLHLAFGHCERESYQRERLGLDPSWCRSLLRIERAAALSPAFASTWRAGEISFLQAAALVPLLHSELPEAIVIAWTRRARQYSLRRLRDDVDAALELRERDFGAWLVRGGLPESPGESRSDSASESISRAEAEREIGAKNRAPDRGPLPAADTGSESEMTSRSLATAAPGARETHRVAMIVESEVAQLFRAVHCSVRRRLEREAGRAVTQGEALGWICAHALRSWNAVDARVRREHRVFARDGWRCAAPGCTRMRGLHAHHVVFRAQGGGNERENLVTLCAYHHLRGVHGGTLRIRGRAPEALRFELGLRAGQPPLAVYASGDRRLVN